MNIIGGLIFTLAVILGFIVGWSCCYLYFEIRRLCG